MDPVIPSIPLTYPSVKPIFQYLPFGTRKVLAISCPAVRSINKFLPHNFKTVEISVEYPYSKLKLDDLEWRVMRCGYPINIVSPTRRCFHSDRRTNVFTATKYYIDRKNTRIHTLNCFFHYNYHSFGTSKIEFLRLKFSFGNTKPLLKVLEKMRFGFISVVNVSQDATIFKELEHFQTDFLRVATVKINNSSLLQLGCTKLDIYEFETNAVKFKDFCMKLKKCELGSSYSGDFVRAVNGIEVILVTLKESLEADEKFINRRKCLCVASGNEETELNITYDQLGFQELFKYRFTVRVMLKGSAKGPSLRRRVSNAIRNFL